MGGRRDGGARWPPDWRLTRSAPGHDRGPQAGRLAAKPEPCDDGAVARVVLLDEIGKKTTALADEFEGAAARVVVLREATEMLGQVLDALRPERDLDLRRSGVTFLVGEPVHDLLLLCPRERHSVLRTRTCTGLSFFYDRRMVAVSPECGKRRPILDRDFLGPAELCVDERAARPGRVRRARGAERERRGRRPVAAKALQPLDRLVHGWQTA